MSMVCLFSAPSWKKHTNPPYRQIMFLGLMTIIPGYMIPVLNDWFAESWRVTMARFLHTV